MRQKKLLQKQSFAASARMRTAIIVAQNTDYGGLMTRKKIWLTQIVICSTEL